MNHDNQQAARECQRCDYECFCGYEAMTTDRDNQQAAREWLPIESCPRWRFVLLWCPSDPPWAETWWIGMRTGGDARNYCYDEGFKIATPYSQNGKQVWCPMENHNVWPTHWQPLPAPPRPTQERSDEG